MTAELLWLTWGRKIKSHLLSFFLPLFFSPFPSASDSWPQGPEAPGNAIWKPLGYNKVAGSLEQSLRLWEEQRMDISCAIPSLFHLKPMTTPGDSNYYSLTQMGWLRLRMSQSHGGMEMVVKPGLSDSNHPMPPWLFLECLRYARWYSKCFDMNYSLDHYQTLSLRKRT